VDVALAGEDALEVSLPARCHPAPDHLAHELVRARIRRALLGSAQVRVTLDPGGEIASPGEELTFAVAGVGLDPPPRRLDCPPPVRRDDQVAACRVQALPELPPGGSAAIAEVEIDRRGHSEDLRTAGAHWSAQYG